MRRIIVGVVIAVLLLAQAPFINLRQAKASETQGYTKVWETKKEDKVSIVPVVTQDGSIYGITSDLSKHEQGRLIKIKDGNIVWSSQEDILSTTTSIWPIILKDNYIVVAGITSENDNIENDYELLFICYNTDGKKIWEKKYKLSMVVPSYQLHEGNIWFVCDNYARVIDPKTGEEIHKIDLGPSNPQLSGIESDDDGGSGSEKVKLYYLFFSDRTMLVQELDKIKAFEISDDFTLDFKWLKKINTDNSGELSMMLNLTLMLQANSEIFMLSDSGTAVKCYDTKTGEERWTINFEDSMIAFFFFNKTHVIMLTLTGTNCFDAASKKLLWQKDGLLLPAAFDKNIIVSTGSTENGFELSKNALIIDTNTGKEISRLSEENVKGAVINHDDLYLSKSTQICKYSKCDPCLCDVEVMWKKNSKDAIESDICSLESKKFEILLTSSAKKGVIDCVLETSTNNISLSETKVKLEPSQSVIVEAIYSSLIDEPEISNHTITVSASCEKTVELKLRITKGETCRDKLKKVCQLDNEENHLFEDVLVSVENYNKYEFQSLTGIDIKTGEQLWKLQSEDLGNIDNLEIVYREDDFFIGYVYTDDGYLWICIDKNGNVRWKRNNGEILVPNSSISVGNGDDSDIVNVDLFDAKTGKDIISGLKIEAYSDLKLVDTIGDKFIFEVDEGKHFCCNSKGKIFWRKELKVCTNNETFKTNSLYIIESDKGDDSDKETEDYFKKHQLVKVDPESLAQIWVNEIDGYPDLFKETDDKIWISASSGLYCINSDDGKIVWKLHEDKRYWGTPLLIDNKICVEGYVWNEEEKYVETSTLFVVDANSNRIIFEMSMQVRFNCTQDDKNLYIDYTQYTNEGNMTTLQCFDKSNFKKLWSIQKKGYLINIGTRAIFLDINDEMTWFENGKFLGKYNIGTNEKDLYGSVDSHYEWFGDRIYVDKEGILMAIDAKTSELLWIIKQNNVFEYSLFRVIVGVQKAWDGYEFDFRATPFYYSNAIFISENKKLTIYQPLE